MADDYKSKLEQFFSLVPKSVKPTQINKIYDAEYHGEVQSGTPVIQIQGKAALPAAKLAIEAAKVVDNATFTTLTGLTHTTLLNNWKGGGIMTSCNAFVMKAGQAVGVRGLSGFNVEDTMIGLENGTAGSSRVRARSRNSATSSKPVHKRRARTT